MKFPYNLSTLRLTLLSEEDLRQYKYEHSPFYSYEDKVASVNAYRNRHNYYMQMINEDHDYDDMSESEKDEMALSLTQIESDMILNEVFGHIKPIVKGSMSDEEFDKVYEQMEINLNNYIKENISNNVLNEDVPGRDMGFWIPNLGWLGKLTLGIFSTGLAGLIGLFVAGKDRAAAKALEKYMNRLVELTDSGVFKKKSIFSFFGRGKMRGDQSQSCFRYCQEVAERTIAKDALIVGKAAGLLSGNGMTDAVAGKMGSGAGMNIFNQEIANDMDKLMKVINKN